MKAPPHEENFPDPGSTLAIMPDGRIFAHNLTPHLAEVLTVLNPSDLALRQRAQAGSAAPKNPLPVAMEHPKSQS